MYKLRICDVFQPAELPCTVVQSLKDAEGLESETVSMKLVLSKSRSVIWRKGDKIIANSEDDQHFRAEVSENGLEHVLIISNALIDDEGTYIADINDDAYGMLSSTCCIVMKGEICQETNFYNHLFYFCGEEFDDL